MNLVPHTIPGASRPVYLPDDLPVEISILPAAQKNQRPGYLLTGGSANLYVQHDTGNTRAGANEDMHRTYLFTGAEGQQLSYHLTVGARKVIFLLPLNEVAWHGGDGAGPCNFDGIASELTVNIDQDEARARRNAEWVAAGVCEAVGIVGDPVQHNFCSGKNCPADIRRDGYWPTYLNRVRANRALIRDFIAGPPAGEGTVYPEGMDAGVAGWLFNSDRHPEFGYNEAYFLSKYWLRECREEQSCPQLLKVKTFDTRTYWQFSNGLVLWRPNANSVPRVLGGV